MPEPTPAPAELESVSIEAGPERRREREREKRRANREIKLRQELHRLRNMNQRLRERLERTEEARRMSEKACQDTERALEKLQELHQQLAEQHAHLQERRRQDQLSQRRHGQAPAISALLPVLDHLQMATRHAGADPQSVLMGVNMVVDQFSATLVRLGVKRIEAAPGTPFQPDRHEAMMHVPNEDYPIGHIVQEISAGYMLNGRLLRAARVSVAAPPARTPDASPSSSADEDVVFDEE